MYKTATEFTRLNFSVSNPLTARYASAPLPVASRFLAATSFNRSCDQPPLGASIFELDRPLNCKIQRFILEVAKDVSLTIEHFRDKVSHDAYYLVELCL